MRRAVAIGVLAATLTAAAALADQHEGKQDAAVKCEPVVEAYKHNSSVAQTAQTFLIDQSRVVECLKAAGIKSPKDVDD